MRESTKEYTVHYGLGLVPPFLFKYYLYTPGGYDPELEYPLVLMLHGSSRHMYGGIDAVKPRLQRRHPMFVVVPIAPPGFSWALRHYPLQAYGFAKAAVTSVTKHYSIDPGRIYVTGYSMGGAGTFGMLAHYPSLFAAAAPLCGYWSDQLDDYRTMPDIPIQIHHGTSDTIVSYKKSEKAYDALKTLHVDAELKLHFQKGHAIWNSVYADYEFWDWLLDQRR